MTETLIDLYAGAAAHADALLAHLAGLDNAGRPDGATE